MPRASLRRSVPTAPRLSRRRMFAVGGAGTAAAILAACSGDSGTGEGQSEDAPAANGTTAATTAATAAATDEVIYTWQLPDETAQAVPGGIYRSVTTSDATSMDPMTSPSFTTQVLAGRIYETLLSQKTGPGLDTSKALPIEGRLAETYEVAPDALSVTFKLRPNVYFHDIPPVSGRAVDIEDLRLSLERFLAASPFRSNLLQILDRAEYPDQQTMVLRLKLPYAPTARLFTSGSGSFWTMPREAFTGGFDPARQPIGTYFSQLDQWQPSVTYEFKKHPRFWRTDRPFIDRWHYPIIPEYAQRYAQFVVGNVYEFTPRQPEVLQTRKDAPTARMFKYAPQVSYGLIHFGRRDFEGSPWRDERVRRALSMMIDRESMRDHFANGEEFRQAGLPQENRWHTHVSAGRTSYWLDPANDGLGPASRYFQFDVAEAKKLLEAAGVSGQLEVDAFYTDYAGYGADHVERCTITLDMLEQAGIKVNRNVLEYQAYLATVYRQRDFRGIGMGPELTYVEIDPELYNYFHSQGGRFKGIEDPRVDQFIERQRRELDSQKRVEIIQEFQKYMAEKMYAIPWDGASSGFNFDAPWLRNGAFPDWNNWLAADTPDRGG